MEYNYSTLEGGGVTNYNLGYTSDWNTRTVTYTLVLVNATVNDNGTTYQCITSVHEGEVERSNTETLIVLSELNTEAGEFLHVSPVRCHGYILKLYGFICQNIPMMDAHCIKFTM